MLCAYAADAWIRNGEYQSSNNYDPGNLRHAHSGRRELVDIFFMWWWEADEQMDHLFVSDWRRP